MTGAPGPPKLAATPARQGRRGRHLFWILAVSVVLVVIALAVVWGWRARELTREQHRNAPSAGDAASFHVPAPPSPS
ncbi:MAG: hypothetical protein ABI376_02950 [Caulobacteraceae bacterium]